MYLSFSFKDINVAEIQLTDDLRRIAACCCSNRLLANPEKTKLLLFDTPQMLNHVQNFRVTFLDKELQPISSARDLGVEFDGCLSYDEHITQVVSKCTNVTKNGLLCGLIISIQTASSSEGTRSFLIL